MLKKTKTTVVAGIAAISLAGLPALAREMPHQDLVEAMNTGQGTGPNRLAEHLPQSGIMTLKSGKFKLLLRAEGAFTIHELYYGDTKLVTANGAQGAVILTEKGKESSRDKDFKGDPWIGTGHGGEIVESVTLVVDGGECPVETGVEVSGDRIVVSKVGILYKFAHQVKIVLTPDGIEESRELRALEDFDDLHHLYLFMYSWVPADIKWLAVYHDGAEESGEINIRNQSIRLRNGDKPFPPVWYAQYNPDWEAGILQYYSDEPIPGSVLVQVRNRYNKYYLMKSARGEKYKPDDTIRQTMNVRAVKGETGDWSATRKMISELEKGRGEGE